MTRATEPVPLVRRYAWITRQGQTIEGRVYVDRAERVQEAWRLIRETPGEEAR